MDTIEAKKEKKLNRIASGKSFLSTLALIVKVVLVIIYGVGYHIERLTLKLFKFLKLALSDGIFIMICNLGQWVIDTGKRLGRLSVRIGQWTARSFVQDFSWWAPCIGGAAVIGAFVFFNFFSVALEVTINDTVVGYVRNESEYYAILNQVEDQIQNQLDHNTTAVDETAERADVQPETAVEANASNTALNLNSETYALTTTAEYSLSLVRKSELAKEEDLYIDVYSAVSELVGTNYGLYIDGELKAACETEDIIQNQLDALRKPYETGEKDDRIDFVQNVQVKKGMFASDMIKTAEQLAEMFETDSDNPAYYVCQEGDYISTIAAKFGMTSDQLKALNPNVKETEIYAGRKLNISVPDIYLQVKTIKTVTYTESIDFSVKREANSDMYTGTTKVKTQGQKGSKNVTAEITYVDGKRVSKKVISSEVTRKPVDKVVYYGTKKRSSYSSGSGGYSGGFQQGSGVPSGSFRTPLPGSYVSCAYMGYRGHTGVDLCLRGGTLNAAVYAADGGTVVYSGWSGGYGNLIRIDHGNGYTTYYAHLNTRLVKVGDKVSSGQQIAKAGSTGNSTGPHLHFEVRYKGTAYNPMSYI